MFPQEVTVKAPMYPRFPPVIVWRLARTDEQIKRDFRKLVLGEFGSLIPLDEIEVFPQQGKAA